jgi:hypothetical protein
MKRIAILALCLYALCARAQQAYPGEGDVLNYRLAGFTAPIIEGTTKYLFEVAEYTTNDKGKDQPFNVIEQESDKNRAIVMLPAFDRAYVWRVSYLNNKGKKVSTTPYTHFRTGKYPSIDTNLYRLKIIDSATHHDDVFVIVDFVSVIYDLKGNPIWYLPDIHLVNDKNLQLRDLKPTHDHTFTATSNFGAFELDYNGRAVWRAPKNGQINNDTAEYYHHEFTKLKNGHYMAASLQYVLRKIPSWMKVNPVQLTNGMMEKHDDGYYRRVTAGNLIEYDKDKKVVWYWKSLDHFSDNDFFNKRALEGVNTDMHLNGFFVDEPNSTVYMSFRNTNEVVKIDYVTGKMDGYTDNYIKVSAPYDTAMVNTIVEREIL